MNAPASIDDARLAALAVPTVVKMASALVALTGLFVALTGVQLLGVRWRIELLELVPYVMLLAGATSIALATKLYRMHAWAAKTACTLSAFLALSMAGWLLFSFTRGIFSCIGLFSPPLALAAAISCALSLPKCARASEVRRQLEDEGVDLGF